MSTIAGWWATREKAAKGSTDAQAWLRDGTLAGSEGKFSDHWSITVSEIVGMAIREAANTLQERQVKAQEKLARAAEKSLGAGDEWRGNDDDNG